MNADVKYLNLDEVEPSIEKVLKIKGQSYKFKQPSVGEFVKEMKRIKALKAEFENDKTKDEFDALEVMIESQKTAVSNAFPDIPQDVLNDMTQDQLTAIREFIQEQFEEESADAQDEAGNGSAAKKKTKSKQ